MFIFVLCNSFALKIPPHIINPSKPVVAIELNLPHKKIHNVKMSKNSFYVSISEKLTQAWVLAVKNQSSSFSFSLLLPNVTYHWLFFEMFSIETTSNFFSSIVMENNLSNHDIDTADKTREKFNYIFKTNKNKFAASLISSFCVKNGFRKSLYSFFCLAST